MENQNKTLGEKARNRAMQKLFFGLLMIFMGSTSYAFGSQYLSKFFWVLLGNVQAWPQPTKEFLFPLFGGLSALLLTTLCYAWWKQIKLNDSTTGGQFLVAMTGEYIAFGSDLIYTAIALMTMVMGDRIDIALKSRLEWMAVILFIVICCVHAALKHIYQMLDADVAEMRMETRIKGMTRTEELLYKELIVTRGLALASANAQDNVPIVAEAASQAILTQVLGQFAPHSPVIIEQPNKNDVIIHDAPQPEAEKQSIWASSPEPGTPSPAGEKQSEKKA